MIVPAVDFRSNLQPVRNQGARSSCLAFATTSAHEQLSYLQEYLSVEFLFCNSVKRTPSVDASDGTTMAAVGETLKEDGQPLEIEWPYLTHQPAVHEWIPPEPDTVWKAKLVDVPTEIGGVLSYLEKGVAVVLGLVITSSFLHCGSDGLLPNLSPDAERGGHAVLAVGHGMGSKNDDYLLVRNSWGSGWGIDGHAWLSEEYVRNQLCEAAILEYFSS